MHGDPIYCKFTLSFLCVLKFFYKSLLISCCFHEGIYSFDFSVLGILYGLQIKAPHLESDEAWG